jgi:hypothetical protein
MVGKTMAGWQPALAARYGVHSLPHQLGGAIAAAMGGYVYVMMGSYNAAFISAGVTAVIAAGLALGARRTRLPLPAGAPA